MRERTRERFWLGSWQVPRLNSLFTLLVSNALVLLCGVSPAWSQFENAPNIIRELQRQQKVLPLDQPIQDHQPQPVQPIPRFAPINPAQAAVFQPKSYSLRLFESEGQLQFHRFTTGVNVAQQPHELQLSDEQEARIVKHFVEQCHYLCEEHFKVCKLDEQQLEKLQAAAVIDATRFVRSLRAKFAGSWEEQQARKLDPVSLRGELNQELALGIGNPGSLFRKIFVTVLTPEQRVLLLESNANLLLDAINKQGNISPAVAGETLGIDGPSRAAQFRSFVPLNAAQRKRLFELIIETNEDETDIWQWFARPPSINHLLRFITQEELAKFLTPPQVQAVLLQKASVDKANALLLPNSRG